MQQRVARLSDRSERAAKSVLLPGEFEQAFVDKGVDQFVGGAVDADEGMRRETVGRG